MKHAAAESGFRREVLVDVKRIQVAGDLHESPDVVLGERLAERDVLSDLEVLDPGGTRRHVRSPLRPRTGMLDLNEYRQPVSDLMRRVVEEGLHQLAAGPAASPR